jgi:glutamyl-tRNA reductase
VPILAVGLTHREAPVELRERLAIPESHLDQAIARLGEFVPEGVILSTCNRTEVYARVGHQQSGQRELTRFLAEVSGLDEHKLGPHLAGHWQGEGVRHLFRVAAGLDSMILGEGQILAQVRAAYEQAARRRPVGAALARLFEQALVVGKRARSETAIARSAVSISQAAVELSRQRIGDLKRATILVIGAGEMGGLAARALRERGAARLIVMNRTVQRADTLVHQLGGEAWSLDRLDEALLLADVAISSTAADGYVISASRLSPLLAGRADRPLVIVDIAVPRDVEPEAASLPGLHLFNVDDLSELCAANLDGRRREAQKVETIVDQEVARYLRWSESREVAPTIAALVQQAEAIRRDELARSVGKFSALSERDLNTLNALTQAIVKKMLHGPISRLKEQPAGHDSQRYLHAVKELFDLPTAEPKAE